MRDVRINDDLRYAIESLRHRTYQIDTVHNSATIEQLNELKHYCQEVLVQPLIQALTGEID